MSDDENIINPITRKSKNKLWYIISTIIKSLLVLLIIGFIMLWISAEGAEVYIKDASNFIIKKSDNFDKFKLLNKPDKVKLILERIELENQIYGSKPFKHRPIIQNILEILSNIEYLDLKIDNNKKAIRLVSSWATREDAVDEFIDYMKALRRVKVW